MASIQKMTNGRYRARYRDPAGKEHLKRFALRRDAQRWLDQETAKIETGSWVSPKTAKTTVGEWCEVWLASYTGRPGTTTLARKHVARIKAEFGDRRLDAVRPSEVKAWTAKLKAEGLSDSYISSLHQRMSHVYADAVHDGLVARSPLSRRTSPPHGRQRPYVASTAQIWALHEALEPRYRAALLLGAFAGLRVGEACGLRVSDVDFMRGIVYPVVQYPAEPLKTEISRSPVPIPHELALMLSAHVQEFPGAWVLSDPIGRQVPPYLIRKVFAETRKTVEGLPEGFRFHDLRHYYASLLISSGLDVKVVQTRLRHGSAATTLDTYGHLWPDSDDTTRNAVAAAISRPVATTA
jgi:integrase